MGESNIPNISMAESSINDYGCRETACFNFPTIWPGIQDQSETYGYNTDQIAVLICLVHAEKSTKTSEPKKISMPGKDAYIIIL